MPLSWFFGVGLCGKGVAEPQFQAPLPLLRWQSQSLLAPAASGGVNALALATTRPSSGPHRRARIVSPAGGASGQSKGGEFRSKSGIGKSGRRGTQGTSRRDVDFMVK
ncbi:hypothetical protein JCM19379_10420 [Methyloparacoccus murrellii]